MTELPSNWQRVPLADLASGGIFCDGDWVESKDQDPEGAVRLTQLADVGVGLFRHRSDRWMRQDQAESLKCTYLSTGDVLIARMPDPLGRACLVPEGLGPAVTAVDVAVLRVARADVEPRFVMWALNSPDLHRQMVALQSGTTRKRISRKNLEGIRVPLPRIDEQRRIVGILEDHLSRLDAAAVDLVNALQRLVPLRESMLRGELTGDRGCPRSGHAQLERVGVDDGSLPAVPSGWQWRRLHEIADVVGGVTKDAKRQSDPTSVEVPYLRVANVQRGRLDLSTVASIRVPQATAKKLRLSPGDVLLNEGGDRDKLGRGWVWEGQVEPCIHQNHVFRARVRDSQLDPYLLSWAANSFGGRWCERNGRQSVNLASISLSKIKMMPIPVPPRGEQEAIAGRIRQVMDASLRAEGEFTAARQRGQLLRRALLAAAFSGRLA